MPYLTTKAQRHEVAQTSCFLCLSAFVVIYLLSPQSPAEQDLIFSHRSHLARAGTVCIDCHAPVLKSNAAEDNVLPVEKTCLQCHDGVRARKECAVCHRSPEKARSNPKVKTDFRFNHQLHLSFGNVAPVLASAIASGRYLSPPGDTPRDLNTDNPCVACHRGVPQTDLANKEHLPKMADCLVCHSKIDPPFSCRYCHTPDAVLVPASHTASFADLHSSRQAVPDKAMCKVCHGVKFTCMGCH